MHDARGRTSEEILGEAEIYGIGLSGSRITAEEKKRRRNYKKAKK